MKNNYVIKTSENAYKPTCDYLNSLGFNILTLDEAAYLKLASKKELIQRGIKNIFRFLKYVPTIKNAGIVFSMGNFETLFLLLLNKCRLVNPERVYWWGFFIHNAKVQKFLKIVFKCLYRKNVGIILFSECEKKMYAQNLGLPMEAFQYIPYGDWADTASMEKKIKESYITQNCGKYFFGGGYSNRNYHMLLDAWVENNLEEELVLIGSKNNKDLWDFHINHGSDYPNIKIMFDVTSGVFDQWLRDSKAVIFPFKSNTGASGQSVALRCMRQEKLIVCSDTEIMREYVKNGKSGLILSDFMSELKDTIQWINDNPDKVVQMIDESRKLYENKFSYSAISKALYQLVK